MSANRLIKHLPEQLQVAILIMRQYRSVNGKHLNVFSPRTFNEKVQVRKLFDRRRQLTEWADKYRVREYVSRMLGPGVLPTLYHVTTDPSDIPFERLPHKYVIKATHGSGWTCVVQDGSRINQQQIISCCKAWLDTNYYALTGEWVYKSITPRIIVEEFLDSGTGSVPSDYKFFVFGGKVKFIQVDVNTPQEWGRDIYDTEWKRIDCRLGRRENLKRPIARPESLDTMIAYAETLSGGIDFVRVDLYEIHGKVYFGELTCTPANGFHTFRPALWDRTFGNYWEMRFLSGTCRSLLMKKGIGGQGRRSLVEIGIARQASRFYQRVFSR
jgi:hypothetical protein